MLSSTETSFYPLCAEIRTTMDVQELYKEKTEKHLEWVSGRKIITIFSLQDSKQSVFSKRYISLDWNALP